MSSSEWIGNICHSILPTFINILELDPVSSVNLFMDKTGDLKDEEVLNLVLE